MGAVKGEWGQSARRAYPTATAIGYTAHEILDTLDVLDVLAPSNISDLPFLAFGSARLGSSMCTRMTCSGPRSQGRR